MRATDIVRNVLDIVDYIDGSQQYQNDDYSDEERNYSLKSNDPDSEFNRFKQVLDMVSQEQEVGDYSNEPNEVVSDVDSVTSDAGGGYNGPKHPDDIRVKDPRSRE